MVTDPAKIFKPETLTVEKLFSSSESFYQVPSYQRSYSWEDEQIEALFDDVYTAMGDKKDSYNIEGYFLGPAVFVQHEGYFEVVDGQQRLTTLTILLCVVRDLFGKEIEEKDKRLFSYIEDAIKSHRDQEKPRLKLITQINMQNLFENEVLDKVKFPAQPFSDKEKEKPENKFGNAVFVLSKKLKGLEKEKGIAGVIKFLEYLMHNVEIITIICPDITYAVKLFQVINTRGLDLSPADLIKSELLGKFELKEDVARNTFLATWQEIDVKCRDMDESLTDILTYYEYYLLAENPKRDLYTELSNKFKTEKPSNIVYNFRKFVDCFYELYKLETPLLFSFRYLQNQVFWKAILVTAKYENVDYFEDLCKELRKMYYLYWIAGYTTPKIKQISFNIIKLLKERKPFNEIKTAMEIKLNEDEVYKYAKIHLESEEDAYSKPWLKPILVLVEYLQVDNSKPVFIELDKEIHADHILPEGWKAIKDWSETWNPDQARECINTIGNLTLLAGRKNIAAQNFSFAKKKEIYKKDGKPAFLISQNILEKAAWTYVSVQERRKWMIEQINKVLGVDPNYFVVVDRPESSDKVSFYTEENHLKEVPEDIAKLYNSIKEAVLGKAKDFQIVPRKDYIAFVANTNFVDFEIHKKSIKLWLNLKWGELDDKMQVARNVSEIGHHGNGEYEIVLTNDANLDYIVSLILESYKKHS